MTLRFMMLATLATGCIVEPVDLENRLCPCPPESGYVCDEARNVCVRSSTDAGAMDAGADDAGSTDSGPPSDAGMSGSCAEATGAFFCDGFETLDAWDRTELAGTGAVSSTTTIARFGTHSLAASCATTDDGGWAVVHNLPNASGIDSGDVYLRVFLRIASTPALVGSYSAVRFVDDAGNGFNLEFSSDAVELYFGESGAVVSGSAPLLDSWMCIAAHVVVGDTGSAELTVRGSTDSASPIDTLPSMSMRNLFAGATYCGGALAVNLDEIALGTDPLPCP